MDVKLLGVEDYRTMPWKNGMGVTREIAIFPEGSNVAERFLWRLSSADVGASGPFSRFPGYERTILLLDGEGMLLRTEGREPKLLLPFEPHIFSGDDETSCELMSSPQDASIAMEGERVVDFNVMADRARVRASTKVLRVSGAQDLPLRCGMAALYCARGSVVATPFDAGRSPAPGSQRSFAVGAGETLLVRDAAEGACLAFSDAAPETTAVFVEIDEMRHAILIP